MDKKIHDEYVIVNVLQVNNKEMIMGVHHQEANKFVTWECRNGEYLWAHYHTKRDDALKDLCERTLRECEYIQKKEIEPEYCITATVKNGKNTAIFNFPTNELQNHLGSIGIIVPSDNIYLGGIYEAKILPSNGKVENALIHLFRDCDSLHTINETTKAMFHSDFVIYEELEEGLKYGKYHSAEEILESAKKIKEQQKSIVRELKR